MAKYRISYDSHGGDDTQNRCSAELIIRENDTDHFSIYCYAATFEEAKAKAIERFKNLPPDEYVEL